MDTSLIIKQTSRTPYVHFDKEHGFFEIKGSILPSDALGFFKDIFTMVNEYLESPQQNTQIVFNIEYYNTSASKLLMQLLQRFELLINLGKVVSLLWFYEIDDFDMHDAAQTFKSSIKIPTLIKPYEE